MAEILLREVQFTGNNPYGTYVAGDVVQVWIETDDIVIPAGGLDFQTTGIFVKVNGVVTPGTAIIDLTPASYKTDVVYPVQICSDTSLIEIQHGYAVDPYAYYISYEDHYSCIVNPPSCNLQVTGTPVITDASSSSATDGAFTVTAQSTNPIQYKLGSDFVYDDGSGHQSTGVFTGLGPGLYVVYIRDSVNCFASTQVTIGVNNTYGPIYRLEYDDPVGGVTKLDVVKRAYLGSVTEVCGTDVPWLRALRAEASQDKFESILSTKVTLGLLSETNLEFAPLYTNNPNEFRINYYKDSVLKGVYKVLPQQYGEDYKAPPYYTYVVATDGLPSLTDFVFLQDDGQRFNGSIRAIELIAFILRKTKLELNIRVGINMYATEMDETDADDPLDQAYVDTDTYYINETEPTLDYVLRQIIEPFGARLIQENAVWNIVRVEEMRGEYDYREFDSDGVYVSNSSYDPVLDVVVPTSISNGFVYSDVDHYMSLCPGYGKIRVFYKLGLRPNILENGDFRFTSIYNQSLNQYGYALDTFGFQLVNPDYPMNSSYEVIEGNNVSWRISASMPVTQDYGNAYIQSDTYSVKMGVNNTLKLSFRYKVPTPYAVALIPTPISIPYQKVRIRVKYGSYYLLSDGSWTTDENFITVYVTKFDEYLQTEIIATQPESGASAGFDFDVRVYHSYIYHSEFWSYDDLRSKVTYDAPDYAVPTGTRSEVQTSVSAIVDPNFSYYELQENTDAESEPEIIRPDDYHVTNNPRQWVRVKRQVKSLGNNFTFPFYVDKISVQFLVDGTTAQDAILREINAELNNTSILEKEITHGSYHNLITTIPTWDFGVGKLTASNNATLTLVTTNVLSADLIYAGYFRDSAGVGYASWTRDGVAEETSMYAIFLQQHAAQYKRSYRRMTGSFYSNNSYFTFLDVLNDVYDGDRLYLPMSPEIDDKNNRIRGEFLELMDITDAAGSDGGGTAPFSSGFTIGFGAGYD
jgi:hypothetical protein